MTNSEYLCHQYTACLGQPIRFLKNHDNDLPDYQAGDVGSLTGVVWDSGSLSVLCDNTDGQYVQFELEQAAMFFELLEANVVGMEGKA